MSESPSSPAPAPNHAWAGRLPHLVAEAPEALLHRLCTFLPDSSEAQRRAWRQELSVLKSEGARILEFDSPAREDAAVLEYMLPREAGRRPDVLFLQNGRVVVLEFKETGQARRSAIDQVQAYARDLAAYHEGCEGLEVIPALVLCGSGTIERIVQGVHIVPAERLSHLLIELGRDRSGPEIDLDQFLRSEYAPLPTLVAAARLLFQNLRLPFIRRAQSAGVHLAVEHVIELARVARESPTSRSKHLVLLKGVPGAGKTLVGLQVAHSAALAEGFEVTRRTKSRGGAPSTFLSGNGPLVAVLQGALKSKVFVQDMHRYIREYGLEHPERIPPERLIVFDEAQRAWDEPKIADYYTKNAPHVPADRHRSEPQLLIDIANRIDGWALVLALVGEGQEIHTGEEGGLGQWVEAIGNSATPWQVHGPSDLAQRFSTSPSSFLSEPSLNLDTTLRAHAARDIHHWVRLVLDDGNLDAARPLAVKLRSDGFPIYVTRDLDAARTYAFDRFGGEPDRRFGILASSKATNLEEFGLDAGFMATRRIDPGPWFNDGPESSRSCCRLDTVVTEFQCQGLELDLPIVCWGDDFWWQEKEWVLKPSKKQKLVHDAYQLRKNAYRVLLTRGREGIVVVVPSEPIAKMGATAAALVRAGAVEVKAERLALAV